MSEGKFAEYWNQAEFCYMKAGSTSHPASKQLWIQMAHDWIGMAETLVPQSGQEHHDLQREQPEPFIAA